MNLGVNCLMAVLGVEFIGLPFVSAKGNGAVTSDEKASEAFFAKAVAESLEPIRPGVPGKRPFWNEYSPQFKYAPSFDFKPVPGASRYGTALSGWPPGYYPIDGSEVCMINAYRKAYKATGEPLYLSKATALANAMTMAQDPKTGRFPTYWAKNVGDWWINAATASSEAMFEFARMSARNIEVP